MGRLNRLLMASHGRDKDGRGCLSYLQLSDNIDEQIWTDIRWKMTQVGTRGRKACQVLVFEHLLFCINTMSMRCLDLRTHKLYHVAKGLHDTMRDLKFAVQSGDFVHLFNAKRNRHARINVYDILPRELYNAKTFKVRKNFLVSGFCRECVPAFPQQLEAFIEELCQIFV